MTAIVKYKDPATGKWLKLNSEFTPEICAAVAVSDVPALVGHIVIDGYQTKTDDFVLLTNQAIPDYNGVWKTSDIGWVRSLNQPGVSGLVYVGTGVTYARTYWLCTRTSPHSLFVPLYTAIGSSGANLTLDDLSDVNVTGAINDQVLTYLDGTWIAKYVSGSSSGVPPQIPIVLPPDYVPQPGDLRLDPTTSWLQYYYAGTWINSANTVSLPDLSTLDPSLEGSLRKGMLVFDGTTDAYYLYWPQEAGQTKAVDYAILQKLSYKATMDPMNPQVGIPVPSDTLEQVYNDPDPNAPRVREFRNMVVINHDWDTRDYMIQVSDGETGTTIEARIDRSPNVVQVSINASANYPNTISVIVMKLL